MYESERLFAAKDFQSKGAIQTTEGPKNRIHGEAFEQTVTRERP
jgi:hypothetical protein